MSQDKLRDLCAEAVAVEGTGAATFLGAMRGHRSFAEAYAGVLPITGVNLKIEEANAQGYIVRWENSTCTVSETGFTRGTCISSSNNNEFEEFSAGGYKRAFVFIPVADLGSGGGAVTSVAGRTGAVTLSASDISGLGTAATTAASAYATAAQGTNDRTASGLRTATTVVSVSAAAAPSSGQVLTATGSAAATWQTPSGASPGGSTTQVQYNLAGTFAGDSAFAYTTADHALTVGGVSIGQSYNSNIGGIAGIASRAGYLFIDAISADVCLCADNPTKNVHISANSGAGKFNVFTISASKVGITINGETGQTADLLQLKGAAGAVLARFKADGSVEPAALSDAAATNNSTYLSTDSGKLSYKDAGGTVHALHA